MFKNNRRQGFTIVELLIVIVVIGILAVITVVAYNGISNIAHDASVKSDIKQMRQSLVRQDILAGEDPERGASLDGVITDWDSVYGRQGLVMCGDHRDCIELSPEERGRLEKALGLSVNTKSYYSKPGEASLIVQYYWNDGLYTPIVYGRSKSGNTYIGEGAVSQVFDEGYESQLEYLEDEIAYMEESVLQADACAGSGPCELDWWDEDDSAWWLGGGKEKEVLPYLDRMKQERTDLLASRTGLDLRSILRDSSQSGFEYRAYDDKWYYLLRVEL